MEAVANTEHRDKERAEAIVASRPLIPEIERIEVRLYTDNTGDPALQLIFRVRPEIVVDKDFIKRFNMFAGEVQTAILHSDVGRFPYTRLEQAA